MSLSQKSRLRLKKLLLSGVAGLLAASLVMPVWAGQFTVTPVRIYMTAKDRAVAVTITNEGDEELLMQADLFLWKQKPDGQDDLTLTEDMFLSPPIIKLAPKARQVVRLARIRVVNATEELTYRVILREVLVEKPPTSTNSQVQIALALNLPIFITPPGAKAKLDCTMERVAANTVKAVCENTGAAHAHPTAFLLTSATGEKIASQDTGGYILQGIKRSFNIKRDGGVAIPGGKAKLLVTLVDGTQQAFDVPIP